MPTQNKHRPVRKSSPTTPDPIEIAMAAEAGDRSVDSPARRLLLKHEQLTELDMRHRHWQIASERAGVALKLLTAAAGVAVAIGLGVMAWQAKNAGGLLIEPFSVPPDLAARGLTGETVASQVSDQLARMQADTNSFRKPSSYASDWGNDIKVAIPTTGVSLGELQKALRQWLGHETRISGEVYRTPGGLAVAVRTTGTQAFTARGAEADIEALTASAAEQVFKATQPYRYARWLGSKGDLAGAGAAYRQLALEGLNDRERAWGYRNWGQDVWRSGDPVEARRLQLEALRLYPNFQAAFGELETSERSLGHSEAALAANEKATGLLSKSPDFEPWYRNSRLPIAYRAEMFGDFSSALATARTDLAVRQLALSTGLGGKLRIVRAHVGLHELRDARLQLPGFTLQGTRVGEAADIERAHWAVMAGEEDWAGLIARQPKAEEAMLFGATPRARASSVEWLNFAYAKAKLGDHAGAAAMLAGTPMDCDRCLTMRGRLAALAGDRTGAERWFAAGVKLAPSFPQPLFAWGEARLQQGALAGALSLFRQAQKRGPNWADPYKFEGDILLRQGKAKEAVAAYAKAVELAPRWGGLHLKWGEALAAQGKSAEAQEKLRTAAALDLTLTERAELARLERGKS